MSRSHFLTAAALLCLLSVAPLRPARATGPTAAEPLESALDRARALHLSGELEAALAAYLQLADRASGTENAIAATARNNACVVLMGRGRYREAVAQCRAALSLRREIGDRTRTARTLNNLGLALQHQGLLDEAEGSFLEARDLNRDLGESRAEVINEANLGVLHTQAGRYARALAHHETAARLAGTDPEAGWRKSQVRTSVINRGVVLEKLGAYREALELYRTVLSDEAELETWQKAPLLVNRGVVYRNLGDPARALEDFAAARDLYEADGDLSGLSNTWLNEALALHLNLARPVAAEESYRRALNLARESGDVAEEIQDLFYLGALLRETGRYEEAEQAFRLCLDVSRSADSAEGRWSSLEGLGRIAWAAGRREEALDLLLAALDEIELVRAGVASGPLRSGFLGDRRSAYGAAAELLAEQHRESGEPEPAERAYLVCQRAKARDLLDAVGRIGAPLAPLHAAEIRAHLGPEVLLEYFAAGTKVLRWEVHRDAVHLADLGPRDELMRRVGRLHRALARGDAPDANLVAELSRSLLRDLSPAALSAEVIRIAPDGRLRYLPFELLHDPAKEGRLLVDRAVVSYLPSGSAIGFGRRRSITEEIFFAGLANPDLEADVAGSAAAVTARRLGLGPLPAAEREVRSASEALPGTAVVLVGAAATETALRDLAKAAPRVLHLAGHAVLDERSDHGAAILLRPTQEHDGMLFPAEIANLGVASRLVVLSACSSALGGPEDGRALASLTGAFLGAGSTAVLATLWEVGDEAAATFSEQFYFEIGRGHPPVVALDEVKRRMRADPVWSHPSLWAGWVLSGDGTEPIVRSTGSRRWLLAALVVLALSIAVFLVSRLRSRAGRI